MVQREQSGCGYSKKTTVPKHCGFLRFFLTHGPDLASAVDRSIAIRRLNRFFPFVFGRGAFPEP